MGTKVRGVISEFETLNGVKQWGSLVPLKACHVDQLES